MMSQKFFSVLAVSLLSPGLMAGTHCTSGEQESFSCDIGNKTVSVCSANNKELVYRFGVPGNVEMEIVSDVHYSSAPYSGGGEGNLRFTNGNYSYVVYSGISNGDWIDEEEGIRSKVEFAGVYVVKDGSLLANLKCTGYDGLNYIHSLPPHEPEEFIHY